MEISSRPDVAIIGGGPAGSTIGTLIKKYNPGISVAIFERETFPRDHVGESQLPQISVVLNEMEVWDKVEAANFPVKIGATYRWGKSDELWDFEFLNRGEFHKAMRPSKYEGQRLETAFQVDRGIYDEILLNHAREFGCDVYEGAKVASVSREGDRVTELSVELDGQSNKVTAKHYVDCSGHVGVLRRAMGVEVNSPTNLQNIAIWDYWQNAEWAVSVGVGGTRIQVLSLGYGWLWFIPLGPDRTSIGLVVPAQYYKQTGLKPKDLYRQALESDKIVQSLTKNATCEERLFATKDWSFLAERLTGENWFLAGESAGFADPILSAGMTLAHKGGRDVAYAILELERGEYEEEWLRKRYCVNHRRNIMQHIRFADFWYTQNGQFSDLKDFAKEIAGDAGLEMSSDQAWRWFGTGGFIDPDSSAIDVGTYALFATKSITASFTDDKLAFEIFGKTHFKLNLKDAREAWGASSEKGRIHRHKCFVRGDRSLPLIGACAWLVDQLKTEHTAKQIIEAANTHRAKMGANSEFAVTFPRHVIESLEAMVLDGWVDARTAPGFEGWPEFAIDYTRFIHANRDVSQRLQT